MGAPQTQSAQLPQSFADEATQAFDKLFGGGDEDLFADLEDAEEPNAALEPDPDAPPAQPPAAATQQAQPATAPVQNRVAIRP